MFPPVGDDVIQEGYADFARRWNPVPDIFDEVGVKFAHEVHPSEIAYDYWSTVATLKAIGHREAFGPAAFIWDFKDRIYHVDCKDTR
jgi:sugar phosphate isomerase/epimerase